MRVLDGNVISFDLLSIVADGDNGPTEMKMAMKFAESLQPPDLPSLSSVLPFWRIWSVPVTLKFIADYVEFDAEPSAVLDDNPEHGDRDLDDLYVDLGGEGGSA